MKNFLVALILAAMLFSCATTDLSQERDSYLIEYTDLGAEFTVPLNKFTVSAMLLEDIVFQFELAEKFSDEELLRMNAEIYEGVSTVQRTRLVFPNFEEENDLYFYFIPFYSEEIDRLDLIVTGNIDPATGELIASEEILPDFWAKSYTYLSQQLIATDYVTGKDRIDESAENKTYIANFYLWDADLNNDFQIEELLLSAIEADESNIFTFIILVQFYTKYEYFENAEIVVEAINQKFPEVNMPELDEQISTVFRLTKLELEFSRAK
jgi:hypothetical protein